MLFFVSDAFADTQKACSHSVPMIAWCLQYLRKFLVSAVLALLTGAVSQIMVMQTACCILCCCT